MGGGKGTERIIEEAGRRSLSAGSQLQTRHGAANAGADCARAEQMRGVRAPLLDSNLHVGRVVTLRFRFRVE